MNGRSQDETRIWYSLREFETRDVTSYHFQRRHSLELSAGKAREISAAFIQGREYFRSASTAAFTVRPLLLYYGVASLSRGLSLFLKPESRETSLKPAHGLLTLGWGSTLSRGLNGIGNLQVTVAEGTFRELLEATENKFYFRMNQGGVNWYVGASVPPIGAEVTLKEIAARVPDLSDQYRAWTRDPEPAVTLQSVTADRHRGSYEFSVSKANRRVLDHVFPESEYPDLSVDHSDSRVLITTSDPSAAYFAQSLGHLGIGFVQVYAPMSSRLFFSPLASCYILSFALGMLCRYFPHPG